MATVEETFEQFKQLPDWDRFPLPEVFYEHFKVKKPQPPVSIMDSLAYTPPPYQSMNTNGKIEIRKPAEGGVREIKELQELPVEQTFIKDETETDNQQDSEQTTLNHPTEDNSSEILPGWDHQSLNPFYASPCTVHDAPCHEELSHNQERQSDQSESSSSYPYLKQLEHLLEK